MKNTVIYKYEITSFVKSEETRINCTEVRKLKVPMGSTFLHIKHEEDQTFAYFLVDLNQAMTGYYHYRVLWTGQVFRNSNMKYLATIQDNHGQVYHYFEESYPHE